MTGVWKKLQTRGSPLQGFRKSTSIMRLMQRHLLLSCLENRAWTSELRLLRLWLAKCLTTQDTEEHGADELFRKPSMDLRTRVT